ncbi:tRNA (adenine(58)-N(1))-methyltransferase non-catalytic subunit TRM6-like isoform X2 [Gigantopelta aegis]|uniref:tRNA (adenine(58)-N(1))-methyltransferase non-catalytic subunit TRM6-like isoform X2 n=1 Tax=Gigantopelta aegis TaxID=1735272 RepID=UPI001B8893A4|nr:tRNA (adenine(58)-N(1))-methyltransferase non-catalytic subunit TRM6-like isoform X2 [Gigantopelta aegis]
MTKSFYVEKKSYRFFKQLFLDKFKFMLDGIIGHPFGTTFELKDGQLVKADPPVTAETGKEVEESCSGKDNRELKADDSNQKLTQQDIESMKQKGVTGQEIIQQLVEHSDTFKAKTEFSQAKYLKKKRKKHVFIVTVLKPTARLLIEMLYSKAPDKICNLRVDSLSQILWYGNVHSGINVAVVDSCRGLVVGSILQRMGGCGKIVQLYPGNDLNRYVVDYFDFPKEYKDILFSFPLNKLMDLKSNSKPLTDSSADAVVTPSVAEQMCDMSSHPNDSSLTKLDVEQSCDDTSSNTNGAPVTKTLDVDTGEKLSVENNDSSMDTNDNNASQSKGDHSKLLEKSVKKETEDLHTQSDISTGKKGRKKTEKSEEEKQKEQQQKSRQLEAAKSILLERNIDCLIVASKYHPTPIVMNLLEFMALSRPVVVYSQYKEPLVDCYTALKKSGLAIKLKLTETWFREYQVLPARTHPTMQMTGTGGYLLTFMVVQKR